MRSSFAVSLFVVLFIAVSGVWGGAVPIVNGSFEAPIQVGPGPVLFAPTGWTVTGSPTGALLPAATTWPLGVPDGNQVGYSNSQILTQILSTNIAPNTTYTLSVWVSQRVGFSFTPDILLLDGSTPIITMTTGTPGGASPTLIPPDGQNSYYTWVDWIGTFTSGSSVDGAPLEISLSASVAQTDFDNVTLNANPSVPEPAMFALVGAGLLGLVTRRRFAK